MPKQMSGSLLSILKRVLLVLALIVLGSPLVPSTASPWWEVRFALTVRGDYGVRDFETTVAGEFTYRARWEGTMEPDGPDFFLYHTRTDVQDWAIRERATLPNATRVLTEKDVREKPRLVMNYILRQGPDLRFDFEVQGIRIPLEPSKEKFDLVLPCSREQAEEGADYNASVSKGKNVIIVNVEGLEEPSLERSFSWEWKRQEWSVREKGAVYVAGFHKATVIVTIIRHT